eukprot:1159952-Pelagomonas_calceolata.AAC.7
MECFILMESKLALQGGLIESLMEVAWLAQSFIPSGSTLVDRPKHKGTTPQEASQSALPQKAGKIGRSLEGFDLKIRVLEELEQAKHLAQTQRPKFEEPHLDSISIQMAEFDLQDEESFLGGGEWLAWPRVWQI